MGMAFEHLRCRLMRLGLDHPIKHDFAFGVRSSASGYLFGLADARTFIGKRFCMGMSRPLLN
jgi:hypothetical protein